MSETTNLKLFKHDNPSTNTNPFDVEQALNENWDKIDTAVGDLQDDVEENNTNIDTRLTELETDLGTAKTNITNIQAEQTTQNDNIEKNIKDITDLQAENANLKAQIPTGQASGEEISLSDSAEMELADFSLEGNSKQATREGYNLLYLNDNVSGEKNGITYNWNGNELVLNGTTTASFDIYNFGYWGSETQNEKRFLKAGTYTFKALGKNNDKRYSINLYNGTKMIANLYQINKRIINLEEDTYYSNCYITIFSNKTFNNETIQFMLYEGTDDKAFEEYGVSPSLDYPSEVKTVGDSGSVEIVKSNKNLINNLPSTTTINGITFTNNGDGTITINGTATSVAYIVLKTLTLEDIDYSISGCPQGGSNETYSQYIFIPSTGGGLANDFGKGATFRNSNKPTVEVRLRIASGYKANNLIFRPQLEKGAATNFVENESKTYIISLQKPFYKIGKYLDSFVKQDKKWYEQHYIKELALTGTENWTKSSAVDNISRFNLTLNDLINKNAETIDVISNCFKSIKYSESPTELGVTHNGNILMINYSFDETTLENFKLKLQELNTAGTPIKIYYVLATPELLECTEEQTAVLEQIIADGTYKEVTHFYTTDDLKPTIELKYYKDLETLLKNQANIQETLNNVQAQLLEIGG